MRSLHGWILFAMGGTLLLALVAFVTISDRVQRVSLYPIFEAMDQLQLEQALQALKRGGRPAVAAYMHHLDELFGAHHYLLNANGIDLASGRPLKHLLPRSSSVDKSRGYVSGQLVITHESADRGYWFVAVDARQSNRWTFFPYYLLVIGVTGFIYWLAGFGVLHPLQRIGGALQHFGQGDLSVRLQMNRRDEIGVLAQSFDAMAERIQTLVAGERRLLEDISHELRSPLTRLTFAVRLAQTELANAAFDRVRREVNRITSLVSEITELTRAEGDPPARKLDVVEIREIIEEILEGCRMEAEFRGVGIEAYGSLSSIVHGDRELLRRALQNVFRNAIRYSPEGSVIDCNLAENRVAAVIAIRDHGPGVPNHLLSRIFEPFFRVDQARDAESGGAGLGLSIAKRAVHVHRGTITAENTHPGLRVQITIPLATMLDFESSSERRGDPSP